jgi:hypothetical protein
MKDSYPECIDIDIDRKNLLKYLRITWLLGWVLGLGAFGLLIGSISTLDEIEKGGFESINDLLCDLLYGAVAGALIAALFGFILYLALGYFRAKRAAEMIQLKVEGPFLRVVQSGLIGVVDRKIHFRAIIDFSTVNNRRMSKYGINTLQMNTVGGGPTGMIRIDGVKNCDQVRDMLAEIDHIRGNGLYADQG